MEYRICKMPFPDWGAIPRARLVHQPWLAPCAVQAFAQCCVRGDSLCLHMEAEEASPRAELTGPLGSVCEDSCLEFFFAPDPGDPRYLNFEWNLNGALYLGFGGPRAQRVRQLPEDPKALFHFRSFRTEKGWGVEYAVPGEFIRRYFPAFSFRGQAAGNFYKCGDRTETPHYLAWSPLSSPVPDFHRREDFGILRFSEEEHAI